ncbi:MAG: hypothetical protein ACRDNF_11530 [Streptosporangiaceae bacterium]
MSLPERRSDQPESRPGSAVSHAAATSSVMLLCSADDSTIRDGLFEVAKVRTARRKSLRMCVSDDVAEQREALFAPVCAIIWDGHGGPGPKVDGEPLDSLLGPHGRQITAEALMLGCCWGRTQEFTAIISQYLARPLAFLGCEYKPDRTHGPLVFLPLLDALAPLIGVGEEAQTLVDAMNRALDVITKEHPELKEACWKAEVLPKYD